MHSSNNELRNCVLRTQGHQIPIYSLISRNFNLLLTFGLFLCFREGHIDVARLLLKNGAAVNVPSGSENNIPLTLACWKGMVCNQLTICQT